MPINQRIPNHTQYLLRLDVLVIGTLRYTIKYVGCNLPYFNNYVGKCARQENLVPGTLASLLVAAQIPSPEMVVSRLILVLLEMAGVERGRKPELRSLDEYNMGCPLLTTYYQSRTIPKSLCIESSVHSSDLYPIEALST